ncbi:hypothetical protein Tco_1427552 [Tanacetum coccineum]
MRANSHHKPQLVAVVVLRKGVPQQPLLGLLRRTKCSCVSMFKDLTTQVFKAGTKSIGIDIPVCLGLTLVKQTQFHLSQLRMSGIETSAGFSYDGVLYPECVDSALVYWQWCIREMSQSLSSNVPDNSPEQETATGHPIPRRLDSPTSQAIQLPELELTLTPATEREHSQEINNHSVPILISQAPGPSQKRSRSPSSPFFPDAITFFDGKPASETSELNPQYVTAILEDLEVEIDTLHADTEDKELLISELQDSLAAAENKIVILQIRVADAKDRHAEDHEQIQKILARLGL